MKILTVPSSGSVGTLVYSRNRGGQYTRARTHPSQPAGTGRRATVRGYFTTVSNGWASLGASVQAAWDVLAREHPRPDSLGVVRPLTGQQLYMSIQCARLNAFGSLLVPLPVFKPVFSATGSSVTINSSGVINVSGSGLGTNKDKLLIGVSKPVSTGRRAWFVWWQVLVVVGNDSSAHNITIDYDAQFAPIVAGNRVFVKFTPVSLNGMTGVPVVVYADHP